MKLRRKTASGSETKNVTSAGLKPHRLDAVPVIRAYLDGHLFRPAALTLRTGAETPTTNSMPNTKDRQ